MKTILVDDELVSLLHYEEICSNIQEIELVGKFDDAREALEFAKNNTVEFALMDIEMPEMNGLELGKELKIINSEMVIIYVTGYSRYVTDALKIKADYFVIKPYDREDILDAVMRAKLLSKRLHKKVKVTTFGRFEVYLEDEPLYFGNTKAKELFALCVHREGANVSMEQAIDYLWPERPYDERVKRLYRKSIGAIQDVLNQYGVPEVFVSNRGSCHIVKERLDCDLYEFLENDHIPALCFQKARAGYMIDYLWAEERMRQIELRYIMLRNNYNAK